MPMHQDPLLVYNLLGNNNPRPSLFCTAFPAAVFLPQYRYTAFDLEVCVTSGPHFNIQTISSGMRGGGGGGGGSYFYNGYFYTDKAAFLYWDVPQGASIFVTLCDKTTNAIIFSPNNLLWCLFSRLGVWNYLSTIYSYCLAGEHRSKLWGHMHCVCVLPIDARNHPSHMSHIIIYMYIYICCNLIALWFSAWFSARSWAPSQYKDGLTRYGDSHVKDKTS